MLSEQACSGIISRTAVVAASHQLLFLRFSIFSVVKSVNHGKILDIIVIKAWFFRRRVRDEGQVDETMEHL